MEDQECQIRSITYYTGSLKYFSIFGKSYQNENWTEY